MRTATTTKTALALAALLAACSSRDFDGLYQVERYTLSSGDCSQAGDEIEREFSQFRIRERGFFGVTIYPVYPCDGAGNCDEDNHGQWNLVTVEDDRDHVSMTSAVNWEDACLLYSIELVIDHDSAPGSATVVLERRVNELAITPYVASTCTTDRARSMRDKMECVEVLRLVGEPELEDDGVAE